MKKVISLFALLSLSTMVSTSAVAEGLDATRFYVGGGLSFNNVPGFGSARGFQFIGGYEFDFKLNEDISNTTKFVLLVEVKIVLSLHI